MGRSRPPPLLASLGCPAPPPSSPAAPAVTRARSGTAAARAAASGTRWRRRSGPAAPPRGRPLAPAGGPRAHAGRRSVRSRHRGWSGSATGIGEFDRVLGGGLVPGSLVLIGGAPGIGKSTITTAALANLVGRRAGRSSTSRRGVGRAGEVAGGAAGAARPRRADRRRDGSGRRARHAGAGAAGRVRGRFRAGPVRPGTDRRARLRLAGARGRRPADAPRQGARHRHAARRPRDQGGLARRPARARAPGGLRALVRGRARAHLPHAARAEEPLRLDQRGRRVRDARARAWSRSRTPRRAS